MKTIVFFIFALLLQAAVRAQNPSDTLRISDTKTSHLVCPGKVSYVQAGDYSRIQAEVVPGLSNLVRVKASGPFETPSSLTVSCKDRIYSLILVYGNEVPISYPLESFSSMDAKSFSGKLMPDKLREAYSDRILSEGRKDYRKRKTRSEGIRLRLNSIRISGDALFVELEMRNKTQMDYSIESTRFWIGDKRRAKASNVQEYQIFPDYQRITPQRIPAGASIREVLVFEKMTIPDKRVLQIELNEQALGNTGRKLSLAVKNKDILQARKL